MFRICGASALAIGIGLGPAAADVLTVSGGFAPPLGSVEIERFPGSIALSTGALTLYSSWTFSLGGWTGGADAPVDRQVYYASGIPKNSDWIAAPPDIGGYGYWEGATTLTFSDTFYLTGAKLDTVHLSGGWAVGGDWYDGNVATLSLNGVPLDTFDDFHDLSTQLSTFAAPPSLFLQDANILSVTFKFDPSVSPMSSSFYFPDDVARVSALLTATPVPEPSSWALLFLGFVGVGFARRGAFPRGPCARRAGAAGGTAL